jgi:energy-converting hydrogenase B subunit D
MIASLDIALLLLAVIAAVSALWIKDLLSAVILLSAFSFFMCLLWAEMGAVDVAFTEAAVGAGVSTAFFVAALFNTSRRSKD